MSDISVLQWQVFGLCCLAMGLAGAVVFDIRSRRLPNEWVVFVLVVGGALHALYPVSGNGLFSAHPGSLGIASSFTGVLVGFGLFLPFWLIRVLGAGDVKLFAAVGAFAGPAASVNLALCVLVAGGLLALARMAVARNARLVMQNTLASLGQMLPGSAGSFDARTQTAWRMPYAVAIAGGVAGYAAWTLSGRAPLIAFG